MRREILWDRVKRTAAGTMCALMVVANMGQAVCAAGNTADTAYGFSFAGYKTHTAAREKRDYTPCYMKCDFITSGASYTGRVVAPNGGGYQDVSNGHRYVFTKGSAYKMTSYVKEAGFKTAAIEANPNYGYSFSATGVWSPDSH